MKHSSYPHNSNVGLFPKEEPRFKPSRWKWALAIGFSLFFIYRSTHPVLRLQSVPPPEFIGNAARGQHDLKRVEKRLAQAYWDIAVHSIQMEYPPKKSLPAAPPPEFRVDSRLAGMSAGTGADRAFYWRRLRKLWDHQETWRVLYRWNTDWVSDLLDNAGQYANESLQQFVLSIRFWRDELAKTSIS